MHEEPHFHNRAWCGTSCVSKKLMGIQSCQTSERLQSMYMLPVSDGYPAILHQCEGISGRSNVTSPELTYLTTHPDPLSNQEGNLQDNTCAGTSLRVLKM